MKLFEVELVRPLRLPNAPRLEDILPNIGRYRFREWEAGQPQEDITSSSWRHPSHTWLLSRRRDGIGVLQIKPVFQDAVISVTERRDGRERRDELGEVTYLLDRPSKIHFLIGGRINQQRGRESRFSIVSKRPEQNIQGVHLYKIVCTARDDVQYPFE